MMPRLTVNFGLRYDVDQLPSGSSLKQVGGFHPTHYNNFQPRAGFAYSFHGGKGVVRGGGGLFVGPFVYSDVLVSWVGASEFTYMNQPLVPEFANPSQNLIGFGPSGAVGACDPNLVPGACVPFPGTLRGDFMNFVANGSYPAPNALQQYPLGYAKKDFPQPLSEQASLEVEHEIGKGFFATLGGRFDSGLPFDLADSNGVGLDEAQSKAELKRRGYSDEVINLLTLTSDQPGSPMKTVRSKPISASIAR